MAQATIERRVFPQEVVIEKLKQALSKLSEQLPVKCAYLFGSYASGQPKPWSDVDVAVVSPKFGENIIRDSVFLMKALEETGLMVEPHPYSEEEYKEAAPGSFLLEEVIHKGIRLV